MSELTFAKTFLSLLDARPQKLPADHISPPQTLSLDGPYTLPRMPTPMTKPSSSSSSADPTTTSSSTTTDPAAAPPPPTTSITLLSKRNPTLHLVLPAMDPTTTTVLELKERVARELTGPEGAGAGLDVGKIKLLYAKKPCADVKTVRDVVGPDGEEAGGVEFGVMVMGGYQAANLRGGTEAAAKEEEGKTVDSGPVVAPGRMSGVEVLKEEGFWTDLRGFLGQRIRDEGVAGEVLGRFRGAWEGR